MTPKLVHYSEVISLMSFIQSLQVSFVAVMPLIAGVGVLTLPLMKSKLSQISLLLSALIYYCLLQITSSEKAVVYHRIQAERRYMKAWRRYMQIMKTAVSS